MPALSQFESNITIIPLSLRQCDKKGTGATCPSSAVSGDKQCATSAVKARLSVTGADHVAVLGGIRHSGLKETSRPAFDNRQQLAPPCLQS